VVCERVEVVHPDGQRCRRHGAAEVIVACALDDEADVVFSGCLQWFPPR
jgi:hypothetical protein